MANVSIIHQNGVEFYFKFLEMNVMVKKLSLQISNQKSRVKNEHF